MSIKNRKEIIYDELNALDLLLGTNIGQDRLLAYVSELETFDLNSLIASIRGLRRKSIYFPRPAEIIQNIVNLDCPTDEFATAIASEIIECISRFGPYQTKEVMAHLGEKWGIVERFGGWSNLCQIENDEVSSTRAQLRELAKVYINRSKREAIENGSSFVGLNTEPMQIGESKKVGLKKLEFGGLLNGN